MNLDIVSVIALVFLIVSFVIAVYNREISATLFAIWSIAVLAVFRSVGLH